MKLLIKRIPSLALASRVCARRAIIPPALVCSSRFISTNISKSLFLSTNISSRFLSSTAEGSNAVSEEPKTNIDSSSFDSLLNENLIDIKIVNAIKACGFSKMTSVQQKAIRPILKHDGGIVARAKTGTGKTLAFGIPIMESAVVARRNSPGHVLKGPDSVIIAPTRDLVFQIADELKKIKSRDSVLKRLNIATIVGGDSKGMQARNAFGRQPADIIVATPGRLLDFLENDNVGKYFANVKYKVLDEADRLLDIGFKQDLIRIDDYMKEFHVDNQGAESGFRTLLFSATIDQNVKSFAKDLMGKSYLYVDTVDKNEPETHHLVNQQLINTDSFYSSIVGAMQYISKASSEDRDFKAIVFLPTVKLVDMFNGTLSRFVRKTRLNLSPIRLHGKLSLSQRQTSVRRFKENKSGILITSDVAARGMDFPLVTHVIQIGVSDDPSTYVHKIGRTARAGHSGNSVLFLSNNEKGYSRALASRGINIKTVSNLEIDPEVKEIVDDAVSSADGAEELAGSAIGFYSGSVKAYGLNKYRMLEDMLEFHHKLGNEGKLRLSQKVWSQNLGLSRREANEFIEVGGGGYRNDSFGSRDSDSRGSGSNYGRGSYGNNSNRNRGGQGNSYKGGNRRNNNSEGYNTKFDKFLDDSW